MKTNPNRAPIGIRLTKRISDGTQLLLRALKAA